MYKNCLDYWKLFTISAISTCISLVAVIDGSIIIKSFYLLILFLIFNSLKVEAVYITLNISLTILPRAKYTCSSQSSPESTTELSAQLLNHYAIPATSKYYAIFISRLIIFN